jgi:hypothetical protein
MNIRQLVEKHAASQYNPPKGFCNLEVASQFRKFKKQNNIKNHCEAVKLFCTATGEQYK